LILLSHRSPLPPLALRVAWRLPAPLSSSSGGLAGRSDQEREARPPCTFSTLVYFLMLVFGARSRGSSSSALASCDGGMVLEVSEVAWAWCPWLLLQASRPLPPNKLKAGHSLDLDLGGPAGSLSTSLVLRASAAASSLPAGRGGEGRRVVGFSGSTSDVSMEVPGGAPPWPTHASCSAASASSNTVALGRPPISAVHRLGRRVPQQGLHVGVISPAPTMLVECDPLLLQPPAGGPSRSSVSALFISSLPSGSSRRWVAGGRLLTLPVGGEGQGLDRVCSFLSRVFCVFC
jgi:hypothetical protein